MTLHVQLVGPPQVTHDGTALTLPGRRPLALLAYLLVTRKAHTRSHLTDLFFTTAADPRAGLRWTLTKLRHALGADYVLATRTQVAFDTSADYSCDVDALTAGDVEVYRGEFLEGLVLDDAPLFDEWQLLTGQQLRQVYQDALLAQIAQHERRGEFQTVVDLAARLVQIDNLREEWRRTLMAAYAALGEWDAAQAQYEACRHALHAELGAAPSAQTTALWARIRRREPTGGNAHTRSAGAPDDPVPQPVRLPAFRTSFVGRQAEIKEIQTLLATPACRLLNVVGSGGIGKTRLAVQAALTLDHSFPQGVFFVPLRQVSTPDAMVAAIVRALGLTPRRNEGPRAQLLTYLRHKSVLLLLDNMEHLRAAPDWEIGEELLAAVLAAAPQTRILATSRERLHMPEEWVCPLVGLDFAVDGPSAVGDVVVAPAVQLFLERARQVNTRYRADRVDDDDLRNVVAICARTAGLPLALELAAAWAGHMSSAEIAASLSAGLTLLEMPHAAVAPEHTSMRAVFARSWGLLSPELQQVLAQLSVFQGPFSRAAALAVTGSTLFALSALMDSSLLETTDDGRYQVHELLRQFAAEKLNEQPTDAASAQARHSCYFLDLCHALEAHLKGAAQAEAGRRVESALANLPAAFDWAASHDAWPAVTGALFALGFYCLHYGRLEDGRAILANLIQAAHTHPPTPAKARARAHALAWRTLLDDGRDALELARQARAALDEAQQGGAGTAADQALVALAQATACDIDGAAARAEQHCLAALDAARRAADKWTMARIHYSYSELLEWRVARYEDAVVQSEAALRLQREIGDRMGMVRSLGSLCTLATFAREYDRAVRLGQEHLSVTLALGNEVLIAASLQVVSWTLLLAGRFDECLPYLHRAYAIYTHYGVDAEVASTLFGLAWRNTMGGHYTAARRYADELQARLAGYEGYPSTRGVSLYVESQLAFHEGRYGAAREAAHAACAVLSKWGTHNQLALALITLAHANLAMGDDAAARAQARALLAQGVAPALWGLGVVALVLVRRDPTEAAAEEFYALLALQRHAAPMCDAPSYRACIEQLQPPHVNALDPARRAAAEARGRALDPDAVIGVLRGRFEGEKSLGD